MSMYDDFEPDPSHSGMCYGGYEEIYWTTKNGKKFKYCDMENLHLKNTILMIERSGKNVPIGMIKEFNKRGIK